MKPLLSPLMRYICRVAEDGSIRKASEYLLVSASAINRQILNFEHQVGTPIFERLPRGVRLTEAGKVIYDIIKDFERTSDVAVAQVGAIKGLQRGHVGIGALQTFGEGLLPQMLTQLRREFPDISYTVYCGNSLDIVRKVVDGDLDIGLCWDPPAQVPIHRLAHCQLAVGAAMAPDHPLARRRVLSLTDCKAHPVIFPSVDMEFRRLLNRFNVGRDTSVSPVIEANSIGMIRRLALNGAGIAFTMKLSVIDELEAGTLVYCRLAERGGQSMPLALFSRGGRKIGGPVERVAMHLKKGLAQLVARVGQ